MNARGVRCMYAEWPAAARLRPSRLSEFSSPALHLQGFSARLVVGAGPIQTASGSHTEMAAQLSPTSATGPKQLLRLSSCCPVYACLLELKQ